MRLIISRAISLIKNNIVTAGIAPASSGLLQGVLSLNYATWQQTDSNGCLLRDREIFYQLNYTAIIKNNIVTARIKPKSANSIDFFIILQKQRYFNCKK